MARMFAADEAFAGETAAGIAAGEALVSLSGLTKKFGDFVAVDAIDLAVRRGEIIALLGPSGCGKTTTLRMIAGLERATAGRIAFRDQVIADPARRIFLAPERRNIGMVFQSYALWPHMTVFENVAYPLRLRRVATAEIVQRVTRVLDLIGLAHLAGQTVPRLSGGQQQRVALARALVYEPALMLFDEPFSNLDAQLRGQMRLELRALQGKLHMTGFFVTHDQVEALNIADQVAIMRDGRVEQLGDPRTVYDRPATKFVRDFLGHTITLPCLLSETRRDGIDAVVVEDGTTLLSMQRRGDGWAAVAGGRAEVSVRPEEVTVTGEGAARAGDGNQVTGVIEELVFDGSCFEALLRFGSTSMVTELPRSRGWQVGDRVTLSFSPAATSIWPA